MNDIKPFNDPIYITRPVLPLLNDVFEKIQEIWSSKWLTNMGIQHKTLEKELLKYLEVDYLTLFCNGTIALELAIEVLNLTGEVITTPFTFPATVNSLHRKKLKPIYCDINYHDYNIDADKIEDLISAKTSAIMPVHVFGNPCNVDHIQKIADDHNLKVIYDAAHCFGIKYKNRPIGIFGDISMISFHATKIFHTIEGGALIYKNAEIKDQLYLLKNFGIRNEEEVVLPGTNAKMNEIQAAIGLLNLNLIDKEIQKRKVINKTYKENLKEVEGITCLDIKKNVKYNYQYFPVLIEENGFGVNRDKLYEELKHFNVFTRKYFYPLCSNYSFYKSNKNIKIPVAEKIVKQILCFPIYGDLEENDIIKICDIIKFIFKNSIKGSNTLKIH